MVEVLELQAQRATGDAERRQVELAQQHAAVGDEEQGLVAAQDREPVLVEQAEVADVADLRGGAVAGQQIDRRQRAQLELRELGHLRVRRPELSVSGGGEQCAERERQKGADAGRHDQRRV